MTTALIDRPSADAMDAPARKGSNELGERLRRERKRRHETQAEAAARFGVNQSSYHRWEDGTNRPDGTQFPEIGKYIGASLAEIHQMVFESAEPSSLALLQEQIEQLRRDIEDLRVQRRGDRRQSDVQPKVERRKPDRR